ncbi:protein FAM185A [Chanos chanos]|uniref:Protein FAM185A n=1 Tax=Chanos chanos TaxID=29144 RepID=A0A6J2WNN4_CHACN|nr:protein FAM185A [Chanos chanos]
MFAIKGLCYAVVRVGSLQGCGRQLQALSLLSRTFSNSSSPTAHSEKPLKEWTLAVSPFTKVKCNLLCDIFVRPLDPHSFPEANRAFITVHGTNADQGLKLDNFYVHYEDQSNELHIVAEEVNSDVIVELTAPIKSDLLIMTRGPGNVNIKKMESDVCRVQTETGHCVLQSVKSHKVEVQTSGGNVTGLGTIHGNVDISTSGDSNVNIKKIQGTTMNVSTDQGQLKVKAIYAESTSVSSSSGNIHLGHVHGEASVKSETGDVTVDSSSGALKVSTNSGLIDAYIGQDGTADLLAQQGNVKIRVPSSMKGRVHLFGKSVEISSEIPLQEAERHSTNERTTVRARVNGGSDEDCWIKATAETGTISLRTQSWFEALRLGS